MSEFIEGQVFEAPYPFVRSTYEAFDADGPYDAPTWTPGVEFVYVRNSGHYGEPDSEGVYDLLGAVIYTVVSVHKPGRFPERVFFTRQWRPAPGHHFGKTRLHIATAEKFRRLVKGYRFLHECRQRVVEDAS